jgi:hypothetical protein
MPLSWVKNPIFPKNRIFWVLMPLSGVKNPIFPKNRIFWVLMPLSGVKNPIFPKSFFQGLTFSRSHARRGNACLHRSAVRFAEQT